MKMKQTIKNIVFFGTASVGVMHCINTFIYQDSKSSNIISGNDKKYYNSPLGHIYYQVKGTGSPLLLIHDLDVSASSYEWNNVIAALSKKHTVYAVDLPGCGNSDKSNQLYTNYLYVQVLTDFIKEIIKEKTDIITSGHSVSFTVMLTQDNPMINKIILVNPENIISSRKIYKNRNHLMKILFSTPVIGRFIYNIFVNKGNIEKKFYQKYYYNLHKISSDTIMAYYEASQKEKTKGKYLYCSLLCGFMNYNISSNLQKSSNKFFYYYRGF